MIKNLFKISDSTAVRLPKAWLDLLGWSAKDNVKLDLDLQKKKIVITQK